MLRKKEEKPLLVMGLLFEVTGRELKEHFNKRIADLGSLISKKVVMAGGKSLELQIPAATKQGMERKLKMFEFAYKHINEAYVYHLSKGEVDMYDLASVEPVEALYQAQRL